jgi:hypothetical protein
VVLVVVDVLILMGRQDLETLLPHLHHKEIMVVVLLLHLEHHLMVLAAEGVLVEQEQMEHPLLQDLVEMELLLQ